MIRRLGVGLLIASLAAFALTLGTGSAPAARAAGVGQSSGFACTLGNVAGEFGFTYSGNAVTPNGLVPVAAVGRFRSDASGNFTGSEVNSLAGTAAFQTITGTIKVNGDCSGLLVANVYQNGQLARTSYVHLQYANSGNTLYGIFQKLVLPDHSTLPVVVTITATRLTGE